MKAVFFPKLAITGILKNKRLYLPYILTCIGMVMMHYIITFLSVTPLLENMRGSANIQLMLELGSWIIGIFALIFLFYTNSFLIRRRKKEFGLYSILGMNKLNIGKTLFWESVIITFISLIAGLGLGIVFSKFAELGLVNIIKSEITYAMSISADAVLRTTLFFCVIFTLILLNTLLHIKISNPISLLHSENTGEKPPKANWLFGLLGILLLAGAYYLAVSVKSPIVAFDRIFAAVLMVIVGTYLLLITGSVLFCRILQKNKKYYYKSNHFVSVSSMVYRMKRNGAGLASICILGTMVLVMISSSACMYFGVEDVLHNQNPRDIISILDITEDMSNENIDSLRTDIEQIISDNKTEAENVLDYRYTTIYGLLSDDVLETDAPPLESLDMNTYNSAYLLYFTPLSDYNKMIGTYETLESNQAMIYTVDSSYKNDTLTINNDTTLQIKKVLNKFFDNGVETFDPIHTMFVVVPDFEMLPDYSWCYGFDTDVSADVQLTMTEQIHNRFTDLSTGVSGVSYTLKSIAENRELFYASYGGLLFLGIMLSLVFIFAAVLIIYYKQISEGYEDQSRFEIMQKVGMTKKDIRKSINSQMLTIFFLPLIIAGTHLAFAFPLIRNFLTLFELTNTDFLIVTTTISFLVFTLFYALVYRITSNAYFNIVSEAKKK